MATCEKYGESSRTNATRSKYPDVIANILETGKAHGEKLLPRTCGHTNIRSVNCIPCQKWLQQIDAGITGIEPVICPEHSRYRVSICNDCQKYSKHVETGTRVPGVSVTFNEEIWSFPSRNTREHSERLGPCDEPATMISLADFREHYLQIDTVELFLRDLKNLRLDVNRVCHGIQNTATELFIPILPCFEAANFGKLDNFIRNYEFGDDLRRLNQKINKILYKFWAPRTVPCGVPNWRPLQRKLNEVEELLLQLEAKLDTSDCDSCEPYYDEKEVHVLRKTIFQPLRQSIDQIIGLLKSWNASHQDVQWFHQINNKSYIYYHHVSDVPLRTDYLAELRQRTGSLSDHNNKQWVKETVKCLKAERQMRKKAISGQGNAEFKKLKEEIEIVLRLLKPICDE